MYLFIYLRCDTKLFRGSEQSNKNPEDDIQAFKTF